MTGLRDLTILLGSRASIDEVSHGQLERLRIDRVRGLEKINLAPFPLLTHFHMEDQLKVRALDFSQLSTSLRSITVWNCKSREELVGIEAMTALEFLWIGKTRIDPEHIVKRLPACLRQATFAGYGKKRDASISAIIESQGVTPAAYGGQLTG